MLYHVENVIRKKDAKQHRNNWKHEHGKTKKERHREKGNFKGPSRSTTELCQWRLFKVLLFKVYDTYWTLILLNFNNV